MSSEVETYLSLATRSSIRRMIFTVVSTPTSDVMSTSSKSSSTSSSTVDLPATARANFPNTLSLVFSRPLSRVSFFLLLNNPNNPIFIAIFFAKIRKYLKLGAFFLKNIVNLAKECINNRFHIEIYQVIFIPLYVRNTSELLYSDEEDKTLNI